MRFESIEFKMPYQNPNPNPNQELFPTNFPGDRKREIFYATFPPCVEKNETVRGFEPEKEWKFNKYDKSSGVVTLILGVEGETNVCTYIQKKEIPLLEFYMLNPDKTPANMELPLSFFIEAWDFHSIPAEQINEEGDGDLKDEAYDYLKERQDTRGSLIHTLMSIEEGKKIINEIQTAMPKEVSRKPEINLSEKRAQQIALMQAKRDSLFGMNGKDKNLAN